MEEDWKEARRDHGRMLLSKGCRGSASGKEEAVDVRKKRNLIHLFLSSLVSSAS